MESNGQNIQRQVWDRVLAQPVQEKDDLEELCRLSRSLSAVYRRMMNGSQGPRRVLLRQLYELEQGNLAALQGIQRLSGRTMRGKKPAVDTAELRLESCYRKSCRAVAEYTARSAQPEYGIVFQQLSQKTAQCCCLLAQLLGRE